LYRFIDSSKHPAVLSATKSKSPAFFHNAVRHLLLDGTTDINWTPEEARDVLKLCTGVVNFAAIGPLSNPTLLPILADMKVQRIAVCLEVLFGVHDSIDLGHRAFASITHLDIFDTIHPGETRICPHIPALPELTHLCLNNEIPWDTVQNLLTDCPRLELFIVLWPNPSASYGHNWAKTTPICDTRFAVSVFRNYWDDWEKGARGLPNFWTVADSFVAQKRNGTIDGIYLHSLAIDSADR
jgi:hypothetical protein